MNQRTIISRDGVGVSAGIIQQQELEFRQVVVEQPVLILVHKGSKLLRWKGGECIVDSGQAVAIAGGRTFDITNRIADDGSYEAAWLVWDAALIQEYAARRSGQHQAGDVMPIGQVEPAFQSAYDSAVAALGDAENTPLEVARHRLAEVLVWLDLRGAHFAPKRTLTVRDRVRAMISSAPAQGWTTPAVANQMAMSEATLRRRLAAEATSLGELLMDVRMSYAMTLLQATDHSVTQIALAAGYESPSRFAVRFRKRFGFAPTAIRGHRQRVGG